jgi:hypothetical protein
MICPLNTVRDVIKALGGTKVAAELCGVSDNAISNWRSWNRMPAHSFPIVSRELLNRGLTAEISLWNFDRKKFDKQEQVSK